MLTELELQNKLNDSNWIKINRDKQRIIRQLIRAYWYNILIFWNIDSNNEYKNYKRKIDRERIRIRQ